MHIMNILIPLQREGGINDYLYIPVCSIEIFLI